MNTPAFLAYTDDSDLIHICLGVETETLCESTNIESAVQLDRKEIKNFNPDSRPCDECEDLWHEIKGDVNIEKTVNCHRCGNIYSSHLSRSVENMKDGIVPVCRPCYKDLLNDEDSSISISYDDAEPFFDSKIERTFDLDSVRDS